MRTELLMAAAERVTMQEAAALLGVSHAKMWQLVKDGVLVTEANPLDRRQKLVLVTDIENLRSRAMKARPKPATIGSIDLGIQSDEVEDWLEANWRP